MRRLALAAVALVAVSTAAAAQSPQSKRFYLALGDSQAYGVQPGKIGQPPAKFDTGYVDIVAARLRALNPALKVVNYSCPGESTVTFARGGCTWLAEGRKLHNPFRGSQLRAALAFLKAHRGQVSPITFTLWGNDIVPAFDSCPPKNFRACVGTRAPKVIADFAARFGSILRQLREAAPTARIVVTGPWNFDPDQPELTTPLWHPLLVAMRRESTGARATFVDLLPAFNRSKARLCAYSFICSAGDPHPTDAGYRAIAAAILRALA